MDQINDIKILFDSRFYRTKHLLHSLSIVYKKKKIGFKLSVVIYSTRNCPFCNGNAKALLESLSVKFDEIDLTNDIEKRLEISSKYNWRTVPIIIINDNFVGGFDELNNLYSEGKLENYYSLSSAHAYTSLFSLKIIMEDMSLSIKLVGLSGFKKISFTKIILLKTLSSPV